MQKEKVKCVGCEEEVDIEETNIADEGTDYEGEPVCENCYCDATPDATITFYGFSEFEGFESKDGGIVVEITDFRNMTGGVFKTKWVRSDAWRGYNVVEAEGWVEVLDDNILAGSEDAEELQKLDQKVKDFCNENDIPLAVVITRSSNVFSCGYSLFTTRGNEEKLGQIVEVLKEVYRDDARYNMTALTGKDSKDFDSKDELLLKAWERIKAGEDFEQIKKDILKEAR